MTECPICRMVPTDYCFTYPQLCSKCRADHAIRFQLCTACWLASGPTTDEVLQAMERRADDAPAEVLRRTR